MLQRVIDGKKPGPDLVDPVDLEQESPDLPRRDVVEPERLDDAQAVLPLPRLLRLGVAKQGVTSVAAVELEQRVVKRPCT